MPWDTWVRGRVRRRGSGEARRRTGGEFERIRRAGPVEGAASEASSPDEVASGAASSSVTTGGDVAGAAVSLSVTYGGDVAGAPSGGASVGKVAGGSGGPAGGSAGDVGSAGEVGSQGEVNSRTSAARRSDTLRLRGTGAGRSRTDGWLRDFERGSRDAVRLGPREAGRLAGGVGVTEDVARVVSTRLREASRLRGMGVDPTGLGEGRCHGWGRAWRGR